MDASAMQNYVQQIPGIDDRLNVIEEKHQKMNDELIKIAPAEKFEVINKAITKQQEQIDETTSGVNKVVDAADTRFKETHAAMTTQKDELQKQHNDVK